MIPTIRLARLASTLGLVLAASVAATTQTGCAATSDDAVDDNASADENIPDDANGEPVGTSGDAITRSDFETPSLSSEERSAILAKYDNIDRDGAIDKTKLANALAFFEANKSKIDNKDWLVVVDFKKPSSQRRFHLVDMKSGAVKSYVVAHGSGSDRNNDGIADAFSNKKNSNASSLGYYLTAEIYNGKHGRSLRLDGLSDTNSNARARDVVIHGAAYVRDGRAKQGHSWGCLALANDVKDGVISKLAGGALIYAGS